MLSNFLALTSTADTATKIDGIALALGIALIVMGLFLIIAVLLQSGKDKRLSGAIAGAAETFFAKGSSKSRDKKFSMITTILAIVFVIFVIAFSIIVAAH